MDPIFLEYSSRREQLNELINRSDSGLATELGIELIEATDYSEDKEKTRDEIIDSFADIAKEQENLRKNGQIFVGIDVIGGKLTEINVTSPTGLQELERFENKNFALKVLENSIKNYKDNITRSPSIIKRL